MEQIILSRKDSITITKSLVTDILLLGVIYMLPTISHLLAFPLYLLDPMRVVIFASILLSASRLNSFILATTIPLFSFFVGGHPVFVKSLLIALELLANLALFWFFYKKGVNVFVTTFISIILSKVLYYILKASLLDAGLLKMELVSTSLIIQALVAVAISLLMALFMKNNLTNTELG